MHELKEEINIEDRIYEIRGQQVMLDSDLAKLYHVETKRINEAVKNNLEKFPERFCFRISKLEYDSLKSKFSTSKGGTKKVIIIDNYVVKNVIDLLINKINRR